VMLSVPVPPENSTTLMRVRAPAPLGLGLKGSGIRPPEKRLDAAGIGDGIDPTVSSKVIRRGVSNAAGSARPRKGMIGRRLNSVVRPPRAAGFWPDLAEQASEQFSLEAEEAGIAFANGGASGRLHAPAEPGDPAGLVPLEMDVRFGTEHGGYGQVRSSGPWWRRRTASTDARRSATWSPQITQVWGVATSAAPSCTASPIPLGSG